MGLSDSLISQFVKVTKDEKETKKETTVYGTIVDDNGTKKVQIDGSDQLTPVSKAATAEAGDRVTVLIKNHKATVTGNLTSPSVGTGYVDKFDRLLADKVSTKEFYAETAKIDTLIADNATIRGRLDASDIKVANLEAKDVEISGKLDANTADINTLKTSKLDAGVAEITYAKIGDLSAATADIRTLMFGSASGNTIQTSFSNSVIAQLGDAQIKSAMIESISADKITAGDIITNDVRVMSEDGKLLISDETLQISDNNRVRVQVGKDAAGDYSINVWDQNGNLMFSKGGITDAAIKDAIIRNDMVSDTANISASKLDIDSLFSEINGSANTIKASQVYLDSEKQTLDIAFKSLLSEVLDNGAIVSSQGTSIEVLQGYIATKIWQQDIVTAVNNLEIGGRNLVATKYLSEIVSYGINFQGKSTKEFTAQCWVGNAVHNARIKEKFVSGETYTIYCEMEIIELPEYTDNGFYDNNVAFYIYSPSTSNDLMLSPTLIEGTKGTLGAKYVLNKTFVFPEIVNDTYLALYTCLYKNASGGAGQTAKVKITNFKIEKGNKATDWTPAPEDFESDVTSLSTRYSEIEQTVDSISTTVASHTTEISKKADSTMVTSVSDKVTSLEQDISGFKTTVNSTYATKNEVDDIEIGGRNFIPGSRDLNGTGSTNYNSKTILDNGFTAFKCTGHWHGVSYNANDLISDSKDGDVFTYSVNIKTSDVCSLSFYAMCYTSDNQRVYPKYTTGQFNDKLIITTNSEEEKDQRVYITFQVTQGWIDLINDGGTVKWTLQVYNGVSSTNPVYLYAPKLERGNKPTDWTPAPEDVDADISALDTRVTSNESSITQLSDSITANVTETTNLSEQMSTLTMHFDLFRTSVSETYVTTESANSKFDQYDSDIEHLEDSFGGITNHFDNLYTTTDSLITRMTTVEQTASDLTVSVLDAAKTATNYLNYSGNGLVVGDLTAASLGKNVLIDSDSVDIRNGTTTLASFGANAIYLGKNSDTSVINLCNGSATMTSVDDTDFRIYTDKRLVMSAYSSMLLDCYRDSTHMTRIAIQSSDPDQSSVVGGVQFTIYQDDIENTLKMLGDDIILNVTSNTGMSRIAMDDAYIKMYASDRFIFNSPNPLIIGETSGYSYGFMLGNTYNKAKSIGCRWNDNQFHDLITHAANGQNSFFGPADISINDSSTLTSTTNIRGKYIRLYNHSGGGVYLGSSGSTAVTSDRNLKKDILDIDDKYLEFFDRLRPITYKYNSPENNGHRDHIGFVAQEVEEALNASGLTTEQFAGLVIERDVTLNPNYDSSLSDEENAANETHYDMLYSLRYEEFISLLVKKVQSLQEQINQLRADI